MSDALSFKMMRLLPLILQEEISECGHACVAMISCFWGNRINLHTLRKLSRPSIRGSTFRDLVNLLEQIGFSARALRISLTQLKLLKKPAILHWNMNHFVVLKTVKRNHVIIHDPSFGIRRCSMEEVSQSFTGLVLEVDKTGDFNAIVREKSLQLMDFLKMVSGIRKPITLLFLLSLCIEVLMLVNPFFLQYVTDEVVSFNHFENLHGVAAIFIIFISIQGLSEYVRGHLVIRISSQLSETFSSMILSHLLRLPIAFFEMRHKGDIQSKFQAVDLIQKKISRDFIGAILDSLLILFNLIVMLMYSQRLTCFVIASTSLCLLLRYMTYRTLNHETSVSIERHAKSATIFLETLYAMRSIKSFLKETVQFNLWRNSYIEALNADIRISKFQLINQVVSQYIFHVEHVLVICSGAYLVLQKQCSIGMLLGFLSYRLLLVNKSVLLIQMIYDYQLISIQLRRLSDILCQKKEIVETKPCAIELKKGNLSCSNLSFQYDSSEHCVFKHIDFHVLSGEKVAIVGPSGCGKSTFLKVMMGLLAPSSGEIVIDDLPLSEFGLKHFRNLTASVMQDDSLFSGSIQDNIMFFDEEVDLNHLYYVSEIAHIHETICRLPMGYQTKIGDMGSSFSGGQKQRILLARALYKRPKFLFLDEATSHLDEKTESLINQSLKRLDMTQIIVAHRAETIRMADRVVIFNDLIQEKAHKS